MACLHERRVGVVVDGVHADRHHAAQVIHRDLHEPAALRSAHSQLLAEGVGRELVHTAVAVHQERQYLQYNITL